MSEQAVVIAVEGPRTCPVKRFVRNKDVPLENEIIRERIISARVMNGLTAIDAAARLGYANSTQLSQIESGERKVPNDWQFIKRMAAVYSVSMDYLMGLSPNPERDAVASQHFAIMRGFEQLQQLQAATMTTAFVRYAATGASSADLVSLCGVAEAVSLAFQAMRDRNQEFDDLRGGAKVLAAVGKLDDAAASVRRTLARTKAREQDFIDIASGKQGPLSYLLDDQNDNREGGGNVHSSEGDSITSVAKSRPRRAATCQLTQEKGVDGRNDRK